MHQGELRQVGTPEQIYKQPVDLFVARFVGSPRINTIDGKLVSASGRKTFAADGIEIDVPEEMGADGAEVIGTVRPEDIQVSQTRVQGWVEMRTYSILPAGSETIINVRRGQLTLSVKVGGFAHIEMDDPVWIRFDAGDMNFYDPGTEKRIE
jgi:multiple sugar transport system ATP-binding protein